MNSYPPPGGATGTKDRISVAMIEDSLEFASLLEQVVRGTPDLILCGIFRSCAEAMQEVPDLDVDVVLVDMGLPDGSGVEVLRALVPRLPETDFLVLTVFEDDETISRAIQAGASGYLLKRSGATQIIQAIRTVHCGGSPLDAEVSRRLLTLFRGRVEMESGLPELTPQENRLLGEISRGASVKEAAASIGVTYATARTYLRTIYAKLGVQSQVQAVRRFYNLKSASGGSR